MSTGNNITVIGNVTRDPELRFTPNGAAQARLGVAVNRSWKDKQSGEWKEQTSFFDVVCWQELAENVSNSIKKGARVIVSGRLEQRSWEKEGEKRYATEIIADEVAPSLRWATAVVEKTERRGPGDQQGGGGGGGNGGNGGGGYGRPAAEAPADDGFGDEPF